MQTSDKTTHEIRLPQLLGKTVGRYRIRNLLGRGGFGEVYLAEDTTLKRLIALKRLSPALRDDAEYRKRLLVEAERVSSLNHPNIAAIYDIVEDSGELLLIMEYVDGGTLNELLLSPLPPGQFFELALQFAEGMQWRMTKG
jgi:eukaryotic-like serine/threonine-protein kinase